MFCFQGSNKRCTISSVVRFSIRKYYYLSCSIYISKHNINLSTEASEDVFIMKVVPISLVMTRFYNISAKVFVNYVQAKL